MKQQATRLNGLLMSGFLFLAGCAASPQAEFVPNHSPTPAAAVETPPAPAGPLTIEQAVRRALTRNVRIVTLRATVEIAEQRRRAATDIQDPEFELDWGWNNSDGFGFDESGATTNRRNHAEIRTHVFVPNPWLMVPGVDAKKAELRAAKADLRAATWLVTCDVQRLFAEINFLDNDLALAEEITRLNGDILKAVRSRTEQGAATATDLVSATRRHLQIEDDRDQTRQRDMLIRRELATLLDLPPESLHLATNAQAFSSLPKPDISSGQAEKTALQCRGDVAALHWRTLAAGSAYRQAYNARMPWIKELKGKHQEDSGEWWIGCVIDVPIFSWTKNHADDVLRAQSTLAGVNETEGVQLVRREVHDAMDELEECRHHLARYDNEVAPLVDEMRQTLATLQTTPNIPPDQIAAMDLQIVESERLDLAARHRYHLALINLERAIGASLSELLKAGK